MPALLTSPFAVLVAMLSPCGDGYNVLPKTYYRYDEGDGRRIFYREAGDPAIIAGQYLRDVPEGERGEIARHILEFMENL